MRRYVDLARELGMAEAVLLTPDQVHLDPRAILKCRWGCEDHHRPTPKCGERGTSLAERRDMLARYGQVLLVHAHDAHRLSRAVLEIERRAFLDGLYFAFAVRYCRYCPTCLVDQGRECAFPNKVRPCDQAFGIDVYRTARAAGLPCQVLTSPDQEQNRYGFVLLD